MAKDAYMLFTCNWHNQQVKTAILKFMWLLMTSQHADYKKSIMFMFTWLFTEDHAGYNKNAPRKTQLAIKNKEIGWKY